MSHFSTSLTVKLSNIRAKIIVLFGCVCYLTSFHSDNFHDFMLNGLSFQHSRRFSVHNVSSSCSFHFYIFIMFFTTFSFKKHKGL